jgi:hypothetical protein
MLVIGDIAGHGQPRKRCSPRNSRIWARLRVSGARLHSMRRMEGCGAGRPGALAAMCRYGSLPSVSVM